MYEYLYNLKHDHKVGRQCFYCDRTSDETEILLISEGLYIERVPVCNECYEHRYTDEPEEF